MNLYYDCETIKGVTLFCFWDGGDTWWDFWIHSGRNDLYKLIKFLEEHNKDNFVGYNNVSFDGCITEWIWRSANRWEDKSGAEIAHLVWKKAQDVIDDSNYGLFPLYREDKLSFRQTDVFRIQHFDNKNRMVGLKRLEYEMDMEDIEDMPVPHDKVEFSQQELADLLHYCHNDIIATHLNYRYVIGDVEHSVYKDNNQVEIREALTEEFGIDCTNFSNSKIGDEIIKKLYCKEANINHYDLPKRGTFRKSILLENCIPSFIKFSTPKLQEFLRVLKDKELGANDDFEEAITFEGQEYMFARGGLHNIIKNKRYISNEEFLVKDADVTGYYPRNIINNKWCPAHLNRRAFISACSWIVNERERLKPLGKTNKKIKGVAGGYKEAANAAYGKMGDMTNWMFDKQAMLSVCISGELSILMLIEAQHLIGNQCIMANTDGATFYIKRDNLTEYERVCREWEQTTNFSLEHFDFSFLYFSTVNDYIGLKADGEVKRKGDFLIDSELHKNKSFKVIRMALNEYFINGVPPEKYIDGFDDIFQFCARSSAGNTYKHIGYEENTSTPLPKLIRYYVSKKGIRIIKEVKEGNDTGARDANVTPADKLKTVCNKLPPSSHKGHLDNVDRQWYIDECRSMIFAIETGKLPKRGGDNNNQINLF